MSSREYIRRRGSRAQDSDPVISFVFVLIYNLCLDALRRVMSGGEVISPSTHLSTDESFGSPTPASSFEGFDAGGMSREGHSFVHTVNGFNPSSHVHPIDFSTVHVPPKLFACSLDLVNIIFLLHNKILIVSL